ncbi:phage portal protein [Rhodovibrionaceae bacterium A322]
MPAHLLPGIRWLPPRRGTAAFLKAYNDMPWLRAAAGKVAGSLAAVDWQVSRSQAGKGAVTRGERRDLPGHPLEQLLSAGTLPNQDGLPGLTGLEVRKVTFLHLDLVGEAFWLLERNGVGCPIATWPLSPHWVTDLPTTQRPFYRLSVPGGFQGEIPARDIILFRDVDPERPYERGSGLGTALADELDADEYAAKYIGAFLANRARPDLVVTGSQEQPLTPEEAGRLEAAWSQRFEGPDNAGRPFFSSGPLAVTEIGQSFRDTQMRELREFERDTIVSVYGLPPEKLGILQNSNRSTIEAADYFFAKEVLKPRLTLFREVLQQRLVPQFGPGLRLDFENPVAEDADFRRQIMTAAPQHFSAGEIRALAGLPPQSEG